MDKLIVDESREHNWDIRDAKGDRVAVVWGGPGAEYQARLMAAAPDLLAACEAAMEVLQSFDLGHEIAFDLVDVAIAKAKGQPVD